MLGMFQLPNIRWGPAGSANIMVTMRVDSDGVLHTSAYDQDTGEKSQMFLPARLSSQLRPGCAATPMLLLCATHLGLKELHARAVTAFLDAQYNHIKRHLYFLIFDNVAAVRCICPDSPPAFIKCCDKHTGNARQLVVTALNRLDSDTVDQLRQQVRSQRRAVCFMQKQYAHRMIARHHLLAAFTVTTKFAAENTVCSLLRRQMAAMANLMASVHNRRHGAMQAQQSAVPGTQGFE